MIELDGVSMVYRFRGKGSVTALDDLDTARGALAQGAADYLTKPFPLRYLDSVLAIHLPVDAELSQA